jgi:hypothetical protein
VRVVAVVVVAVVVVVLVVGVTVLEAVVLVADRFALELVLDERELVADATVRVLAVVRLAEDDVAIVTEAGVLEPHAATNVASAAPSPSAVAVGKIFIGRV